MKKQLLYFFAFLLLTNAVAKAQTPFDEEKVKKAMVLMKQMMEHPDEMMSLNQQMVTLKLSSAERKEAEKRLQQQIMGQLNTKMEKTGTAADKTIPQTGRPRTNMVPARDAKKLAAIPATPSQATLVPYLQKLTKAVQAVMPAVTQQESARLLEILKQECTDARDMGATVTAFWLSGRPEHALLLAGQVCLADPANPVNINNYAALLNMMDAQHTAVPLLEMLNRKYPGNATVLGNLGQSWFGMGELAKAEKYLDSAIKFFPKHAQANMTKSIIQEQKGDKTGAAESVKTSLETGYTDEKAARLRKLGFSGNRDVSWPLHIPQDPLGFNQFILPAFPRDIDECLTLRPVWDDHWKKMRELEKKYGKEMDRLQSLADAYETEALKKQMENYNKSSWVYEGPGPLSSRAAAKLSYLMNDKDGSLSYKYRKAEANMVALADELKKLDDARDKALEEFQKQQPDCGDGEGSSGNAAAVCCEAINNINNTWLAACNKRMNETFEDAIKAYKQFWSAEAYFLQYNMSEPSFEAKKAQYKHLFAAIMAAITPRFVLPAMYCTKPPGDNPFKPKPLQDFDDVTCNYHGWLNLKLVRMDFRCNRMTTTVDLGKFKFAFTEDLNKAKGILPNSIVSGSADLSITIGNKGLGSWTPVKAEAGAGAELHVEFTGQGISEVSATVKGDITVKTDVITENMNVVVPGAGNKSVHVAGASATISLNSGSSVTGNGALGGLKL